ncbi:MAG TPA: zinc-binding dehydrogenase [Candidatus Cloacimonadota bacterium]|jgi:L-erythro-3,5-diaminohexanoate dehydrogenase|nr:MAG: L-erythro-3,5-diaminohexanoate dehydrogenase [Candidatus Cloacimonetes bacterium ADurb.Bin088]HOC94404.1 zinc-binding dehydrogenase [Candidatus Cloacimonadota bacterium]HPX67673.1 zinc-binding dehydrogenase [Candidatus Syntrophosphaera sp.]HOF59143.1 zinc-binding dehydrogenase [Candidatus Cloacimonadota bacterium]HOR58057.1 zinc-binding dehydrogenase [Candidatus Cloacimonadota bacterium]
MKTGGCRYGTHRVIEPSGVLPQPARVLNNDMSEIWDNEMLIDVIRLNVDSASFHQIKNKLIAQGHKDLEKAFAEHAIELTNRTGKHKNEDTGSGGMLIGKVAALGPNFEMKDQVKVGDTIASLVSLSLTPLKINKVKRVLLDKDQVEIEGQAILFSSGIYAKLPDDMDINLALSVLDVAGAPAQVERLARPGDTVVIIGANGKSGILCNAVARERVGVSGKVIGVVRNENYIPTCKQTGCHEVIIASATDALAIQREVSRLTNGKMADVVINVVNVEDTELPSIMACKDRGIVYFFSMATSFTKAALGAEGIGADVDMILGNGYARSHAAISLDLLRRNPVLMKLFQERYTDR